MSNAARPLHCLAHEVTTMKTLSGLLAASMMILAGCGGDDDTGEKTESNLETKGDEAVDAGAGCFSVRDNKQYAVGEKLVGKHDQERCPASTKVCLAPDSNYSSECRADGSWAITEGNLGGL